MLGNRKLRFGQDNIGYILIAPFYIFFFFFIVFPILMNLVLSFARFDLRSLTFVGLQNYQNLFVDKFFTKALVNTGVYTFFTLLLTIAISLVMAVLLNEQIVFRKLYRTVFFLPHVTSMVAVSMIWLWIYEPSQGALNNVLTLFGFPKIAWLYDVRYAMLSIIIMSVWKYIGYNMVIYLAGLQTIPQYLYEAALIDGANAVQRFLRITFPMLRPVTFFIFVTGLINNFNVFEQVWIMTQGGPLNATTTLVHQIYIRAFYDFFMGYASAMAFVSVIIIAIITLLNFKYGKQGVDLDIG